MSSYSGFSNRKIQDKYNNCLKQLISLLTHVIITHVDSSKIIPFRSSLHKIQNQIKKLDLQKYSEPKFSKILQPLTQHFQQLDCIKQWQSEPEKKRKSYVSNNFARNRNGSLDEARKTISFSISNGHKKQNAKQTLFKQNRYNFQLGNEKQIQRLTEKLAEQMRNKRIYRSRQISVHLMGPTDNKYNFDHSLTQNMEQELTMEELMKRNPLIQRKMSAHRRKRLIKFDFPQIRQEQQEAQQAQQDDDQQTSKLTNDQTPSRYFSQDRSSKSYPRKLDHEFSQYDEGQVYKSFVKS